MYGTIADLLNEKGRQVYTISRVATVRDAVREMNEKGVGALLIMNGAEPVGIFTERDVLRRVVDVARDPDTARVVEVMTPHPMVARRDMRVAEAMSMMTSKRFRHLPVVDTTGAVVGIVSIGDVLRWVTMHQQSQIAHLTDYITGPRPA
jgi:CBS domain-containing protein